MANIVEISSLVKKYGELTAVNDISFTIKEGSFFAFLGPNGAGKTTTINVLCTLLDKTSGNIQVDGYELGKEDSKIRNSIGVVFQDSVLDNLLTVRENIESRASFYNIIGKDFEKKLEAISEDTGINDFIDRKYGKLSGGQRRRADIARALINTPKLLFLDEPTTGLDPFTRKSVWQMIKRLQEENGVTVFLTTHYMEEAASADDVAIIDNGKIVATGTPAQLRVKYSSDYLKVVPNNEDKFVKLLKSIKKDFDLKADVVTIQVKDSMEALDMLKKYEDYIKNFEVVRGNMDDVFINVTGHAIMKEGEEV